MSTARSPSKRLLTELAHFRSSPPSSYLLALIPSATSLLSLRAILSGHTLPLSSGYRHGRWLLAISVPHNYPFAPPNIRFVTKICHPNVSWETGEICLDVLGERWTPVLGLVGALECVGRLLTEGGVDSPLGVEVAALERDGDHIGKRALVAYWCAEERFDGSLDEGENVLC